MGCGCGRLLGVVCPLLLLLLLHVGECRGGWDAGAGLLLWGCERGLLSSRFSFPSLTPLPGWMWRCGNGGSLRRGSRSRTCASSPSLLPLFLLLSLLLSPLLCLLQHPPISLSHSKPEPHFCLFPISSSSLFAPFSPPLLFLSFLLPLLEHPPISLSHSKPELHLCLSPLSLFPPPFSPPAVPSLSEHPPTSLNHSKPLLLFAVPSLQINLCCLGIRGLHRWLWSDPSRLGARVHAADAVIPGAVKELGPSPCTDVSPSAWGPQQGLLCSVAPQNHEGWKRPLRSPNPPSLCPLTHIPSLTNPTVPLLCCLHAGPADTLPAPVGSATP